MTGAPYLAVTRRVRTGLALFAILFCAQGATAAPAQLGAGGDGVRVGDAAATCDATLDGTIRWNTTSEVYEFCDTEAWTTLAPAAVGGGTPVSFSVHKNGTDQSFASGASGVLVTWAGEHFDTNNNFDLTTERFTPSVAGKYILTTSLPAFTFANPCATGNGVTAAMAKNGVQLAGQVILGNDVNAGGTHAFSVIADANGTTDYFTVVMSNSCGGAHSIHGISAGANFSGALLQGGGVMTMVPGWPDAIQCTVTNPAWGNPVIFNLIYAPWAGDGLYYYRLIHPTATFEVKFNANGTFNSYTGITTSNCNISTSALYAAGRAFNFVGAGGGAGDHLGNHTATQDLDLATNDILNAATAEIGLGAVGTPSLYLEGDPNTGLFSGTADTLSVTAGGVETARFLNTASAVNYFTFAPSIGTNTVTLSTAGTGATVPITLDAKGASAITLADAVTASGTLGVTGNATFDTTTMFVDAASNEVGVGTAAPDSPLHVVGDVRIDNDTNTTNKGCIRYDGTGNKLQFSHDCTTFSDMGTGSGGGGGTPVSFSVHKNGTAQSINAATATLVTWSTETFDTANAFASNRFTPNVAGKYLLTATGFMSTNDANTAMYVSIRKNGVELMIGSMVQRGNSAANQSSNATVIADANGTTDYFEVYIWHGSAVARNLDGTVGRTSFTGALLEGGGVMTMVPGWPDAIRCYGTTGSAYLHMSSANSGSGAKQYVSGFTLAGVDNLRINFNSSGTWVSTFEAGTNWVGWYETNCNSGATTISSLYAAGNAFNFVGAGGGSATPPGGADREIQFNNAGAFGGSADFKLMSDGDLLLSGTYTGTASVPATGAGTRMFFDTQKAAFRAGESASTQWDNASIGNYSVALGAWPTASGNASVALGMNTFASGANSLSTGSTSNASGDISIAMGDQAAASGLRSTSIGTLVTASGANSMALGQRLIASGIGSVAMGRWVTAGDGTAASGFGDGSMALGLIDDAVTISTRSQVTGIQSMGIFMGDQDGLVLSTANQMSLLGGKMVIDPAVPATNLVADTSFETSGTIKIGSGGEACDAAREGSIQYLAASDTYQVCATAGSWSALGGGGTPAGATTQIQFNNAGAFGADADYVWDLTNNRLSLSLGTASAIYDLNFGGEAARTAGVLRRTAAASAGSNLTLNAGGATLAGTNLAGGTLNIAGGTATGSGQSKISFQVAGTTAAGALNGTGTADGAPVERMALMGDGDFIVNGGASGYTGTASVPVTGAGTRMFFDVQKAAFRAGLAVGTGWDNASIGDYSMATGANPVASGSTSTAMGLNTTASGSTSTAMGQSTTASGSVSTAMGFGTAASGIRSIATGESTIASGIISTAMGRWVTAGDGTAASGFGDGSMAIGLIDDAVTISTRSQVTGIQSMGIFMGDQDGLVLSTANQMSLLGGKMVIDPAVPATNLVADTSFETSGTIKIGSGGEACDAAREGSIQYLAASDTYQVCATAGAWSTLGGVAADSLDYDDFIDAMTLDASTTIAGGNARGMTISSDLTAGARSGYLLQISQANNVTNDSSAGLMKIENLDTASNTVFAALLNITQTGSGYGIYFPAGGPDTTSINGAAGYTTGRFISAGAPSLTTGTLVELAGGISGGISAFTGDVLRISPTRALGLATTITDTGNYLEVTRANTSSIAGAVYNHTGDLVRLSSTMTQTAGTITDSSSILSVAQNYAAATGDVVEVINAGTGLTMRINDDGTATDTTPFLINNAGNVGVGEPTPADKLHVAGQIRVDNDTSATNKGCIRYEGTTNKIQFSHDCTTFSDMSAPDNLGNHTATTNVNFANNALNNVGPITGSPWNVTYDTWIQGGVAAAAGGARNLALLGVDNDSGDILYLNYLSEYAGGTQIGGPVTISGNVTSTGTFAGSGASLTNLNASSITSGTVGTARLGSGTANASTYLRGDGTWAAAAGDNLGAGGTTTGAISINNGSPTIYFQDADQRTAMLHNNGNLFYLLTGNGVNSTTWAVNGTQWPLVVDLTNDNISLGGNVYLSDGNLNLQAAAVTSSAGTVIDANGGWFRTYGATGWYNSTYVGGWHMSDPTWIRSYGGKHVYVDQIVRADGGYQVDGLTVVDGTGRVQTSALGSGTADSTTFLRGDGTWAAPSGGGGPPSVCAGVTAVGGVCADGTVFAGVSPFDNAPIYVTRCDEGMTWNGSSCTGTRATVAWNDGTPNLLDIAAIPNNVGATLTNGQGNTMILAVFDCATTAGVQNCVAAKRCADLSINGHDDWFLPAREELAQFYVNRAAIGNFSTGVYWSSSEDDVTNAWKHDFSNGVQFNYLKYDPNHVRCARRD